MRKILIITALLLGACKAAPSQAKQSAPSPNSLILQAQHFAHSCAFKEIERDCKRWDEINIELNKRGYCENPRTASAAYDKCSPAEIKESNEQ